MRLISRCLLLCTALVATSAAYAFQVGAYFDMGNLDFQRSRQSDATELPGATYLWGISATGTDQLSDQLSLDLSYQADAILRNVAYATIRYSDQYFSLAVGPFFGILNAPGTTLQSGLSTTVSLFIPGLAFVRLRSDNSLSGRLVVVGDYIQERSELALGFFVPNAIPTLYVRSKRYTGLAESGEVVDARTEYGLETALFQKNVPYRLTLNFAYQDTRRTFALDPAVTHSFGSLVLGTAAEVDLFGAFTAVASLETSIYTFGTNFLLGEVSADSFLFRLRAGVALNLDALSR